MIFGKQNRSVANTTNERLSCSILEEQILATIKQVLFCKEQQRKSLIHLQYTTLLCHNFRSNVWETDIKIQRNADLLSFVFRAWDSTMWNKPDICSASLQVEMCWLLDPLRICGPVKQHNFWLQSNTLVWCIKLWIQKQVAVLHKHGGLALLNKRNKSSYSCRKMESGKPLSALDVWNTLGLLLPVHQFRNCTGSDHKW